MILLTALPRVGKTTVIHKIVNMLGIKNCGGFYTEEIRENNERVGFMIKTLSGKTGILAHINLNSDYKVSKYGVDINIFEEICIKELKEAINNKNIKYIIIDEIGPMQLFSDNYKELLLNILKLNKKVIGTIYMNPYEWLDDFKKKDGVELIEVTLDNRDELPLKIVDLVTKDDIDMQRKVNKAKKYSSEKDRFKVLNDRVELQSEHGIRIINKDNDNYTCNCDFYKENGTCSHIMATINSKII